MAKIIAAIIAAIIQLITPAPETITEHLEQQMFTRPEIQEIAETYAVQLPIPDNPEYREKLHEIKKDIKEDIAQIVEEKKAVANTSIVPCLNTACKPTPIPTPTFTPLPTLTPNPTHPPKPTITSLPDPQPTMLVPTIIPWKKHPDQCPTPPMILKSEPIDSPPTTMSIIECLDWY